MAAATFAEFDTSARAEGFDEVLVREWRPDQVVDTHVHPFALKVLVVAGEFRLTEGEQSRLLCAGEGFELARDTPHAEHYGPEGATFWVARRHQPAQSS